MDTASFSPISLNDVIPKWNDAPDYVLSIIRKLVSGGIGLLIFSGETDGRAIVSSARYALNRLRSKTIQEWNPWYVHKQLKLHIGLLHFWGALSTRESWACRDSRILVVPAGSRMWDHHFPPVI
ncbi:hypothetical protein C4D60_Mb05t15840 [Musa balbisiana]|uniref:Uncharacterized protein n=1 Tax=Musa balbisiana TaxID=52838 RepID=A0A4S8JWH2_MUSBA|nr:hypothetical protein C4D60_Mb05t15840 [Musa balbisiana]